MLVDLLFFSSKICPPLIEHSNEVICLIEKIHFCCEAVMFLSGQWSVFVVFNLTVLLPRSIRQLSFCNMFFLSLGVLHFFQAFSSGTKVANFIWFLFKTSSFRSLLYFITSICV